MSVALAQVFLNAVVALLLGYINIRILRIAKDTHTLVNSNMGVQLQLTATALQRIANITKDKDDMKAARLAKTLLMAHEQKQAVVDAA